MRTRMRRLIIAAGAAALLTLALAGPAVTAAQAGGTVAAVKVGSTTVAVFPPTTFHPGRGAGILRPTVPSPSAASFVGAAAASIAIIAITAFVVLTLDRRTSVQLRVVEGSGVAGQSPPQAQDQDRKAA
jgi:hypothetical protein